MCPAVTRVGDNDITHCSPPTRAKGSDNVFANGKQVSRQGDANTVHLKPRPPTPPCEPHSSSIASGSGTVFVNGKGCGRVGDSISSCTAVAQGSGDVFAG